MDDFFAKKDAKKKTKGKKVLTPVTKSKPTPPVAPVAAPTVAEPVVAAPVVAEPVVAAARTEPDAVASVSETTEEEEDGAAKTKKKEVVIEDGWVQDVKKEVDLSGLKIAEYVPVVKDVVKDEQEAEEAIWARKQIEAGIPDMQVDIGNDGKTEQQIAEEKEKAVWKPRWRDRAAEEGRMNQGRPPTLNSQSFPSLQQTTSQVAPGGERAVGLKSFTEVRNDRRGNYGGNDDGYRGGYSSSGGSYSSSRSSSAWGSQNREQERGNRFESLGRR